MILMVEHILQRCDDQPYISVCVLYTSSPCNMQAVSVCQSVWEYWGAMITMILQASFSIGPFRWERNALLPDISSVLGYRLLHCLWGTRHCTVHKSWPHPEFCRGGICSTYVYMYWISPHQSVHRRHITWLPIQNQQVDQTVAS